MDIRDSVPPNQNQDIRKHNRQKYFRISFIVLLLLVLLAAGVIYKKSSQDNKPDVLTPYSLKFQAGRGISFDKPTSFDKPAGLKLTPFQVFFTYKAKDPKVVGGMMAVSQPILDKQNLDLDKFDKDLAAGNLSGYEAITKSLQQYVISRLPDYKLTFGKPAKFSSDNIKSDALSMDFSGPSKKSSEQQIKGRTMLVLSAKADYTFAVYASSGKWQANQAEWAQIFNSLKIDQ
jgi:hypothetical protein